MKGLLLKDLYNLKRVAKQYIFIIFVFAVWCIFMKNESMFAMMTTMSSAMMVLTSLSFDEVAHFEKYMLTLPVSREDLVRSKYLLLLLLLGIGFLVGITGSYLMRFFFESENTPLELFVSVLTLAGAFLFVFSILLPIVFKLGVEKARMIMVAIYMAVFLAVFGVITLVRGMEGVAGAITDAVVYRLCGIGIVLALCVVAVTYRISLRIVRKREW